MASATKTTAEDLEPPTGLIELCHHRWAIPVLASLHETGGSKFITLINTLELPRATLTRTLDALIEFDFVLRNPGYGHPMRPEFLLTPFGEDIGPACGTLWKAITSSNLQDTTGRKWALPIVWALSEGVVRFNDLRSLLPGLTPRALTMCLGDLDAAGLVQRTVTEEHPPGVRYELTSRGDRLARATGALVESLRFDA